MYKQNSEYKSIQKKLVAAVAMVLVACIMVVSSSYAWFTLSTAPEVTGIKTSVGSNGNLEMALRVVKDLTLIGNAVGGEETIDANKTWGNLVDLSDGSYHLSDVSLAPARLNIVLDPENSEYTEFTTYTVFSDEAAPGYAVNDEYTDGGKVTAVTTETNDTATTEDDASFTYNGTVYGYKHTITTDMKSLLKPAYMLAGNGAYLQTPVYGTDGRLESLTTDNVINGIYSEDAKGFAESVGQYGVRAVGTISNLSPEEMALRTAKQAVSTAISTSKSSAITSLREDSVKLANMLVNAQLASAAYTEDDVKAVNDAIKNLEAIYANLENALKQAIIAVGVAQGHEIEATDITIANGTFTVTDNPINWDSLTSMQATILAGCDTLKTMNTDLTNAKTAIAGGTSGVQSALGSLLDTRDFIIIDSGSGTPYSVEQMKNLADTNPVTAAKVMMGTPTISIKGGIYHDIALFSGNYSATATMKVKLEYNGIKLDNEPLDVVMATNAQEKNIADGVKGFYLPLVLNQLSSVTVSGGESTNKVITDIYGYAVDLAFRTNAAGSSLLLQTEAANRVEDSEQTQGAGSFMQFTSANDTFSLLQVINLMNSIRVVFINDNGQVYGVAAMQVAATAVMDGTSHVEYAAGTAGHDLNVDGKAYTLTGCQAVTVDDKTYIKAALNLYGFSIDSSGVMTLGTQLASNTLTELQQNTALGVTTLVYLDGDTVENEDVAINGNSMTGTMNLQFASDAELDPMDYTFTQTLAEPTYTLTDAGVLTVNAVENATSYKLTATGINQDVTVGTEYNLAGLLQAVSAPSGSYTFTLTASGTGYASSSVEITYEYTAP